MLRRGTGEPRTPSSGECETHDLPVRRMPVRGLLKLLQGQIPATDEDMDTTSIGADARSTNKRSEPFVSVYRYHGPTLRESQKELQKKKRTTGPKRIATTANNNDNYAAADHESPLSIPHPKHSMAFESVVRRHKFVAFFVVQGFRNVGGKTCYSAHTLNLRRILATDYHDVMTTFVLDLVGGNGGSNPAMTAFVDEETGETFNEPSSAFCNGTGFCLFPTDGSVSTLLALLNVSKIPAVVVLDAFTGRIVAGDAILAIERNDGHTVVNRWQSGRSGLSILQQMGAVATCDCSHGPCCSGSGGGCCVVQ